MAGFIKRGPGGLFLLFFFFYFFIFIFLISVKGNSEDVVSRGVLLFFLRAGQGIWRGP